MCMQISNRPMPIYGHPYLVAAQEWGGVWYREAKCVSEGAKSNNLPKRTTKMADCCHFPSDPCPPPVPGRHSTFFFPGRGVRPGFPKRGACELIIVSERGGLVN